MPSIRPITAVTVLALVSSVTAQDWALTGGGSWHDPANWSPQSVPNGVGAGATIADVANGGSLTSSGSFMLDNSP